MAEKLTKEEMLEIVSSNIDKLEKKEFNVFFYVFDTKGTPNGTLEYIYQLALTLKNLGYNVTMLHHEKDEFVGVTDWLGDAYNELVHKNTEKENVDITASDFLFIPELLTNVMIQTKKLPCKRIMILQNFRYLTEFMPITATFDDLRIHDCICTTEYNEKMMNEYFPQVQTHVVHPCIKNVFRNNSKARKLAINIVAKDQNDVNMVIKPFYWKYPVYQWVSFRDLRGVTEEVFADALRDAPITICIDTKTNFGYTILESVVCGAITLAQVPEHTNEWIEPGNEMLNENVIWFDDIHKLPDMIASLVRGWTEDTIPEDVYETINKGSKTFSEQFSEEHYTESVKLNCEKKLFATRLKEFTEVKNQIENNIIK